MLVGKSSKPYTTSTQNLSSGYFWRKDARFSTRYANVFVDLNIDTRGLDGFCYDFLKKPNIILRVVTL